MHKIYHCAVGWVPGNPGPLPVWISSVQVFLFLQNPVQINNCAQPDTFYDG